MNNEPNSESAFEVTLLTVTEEKEAGVSILVSKDYANPIRTFLNERDIQCGPTTKAVFQQIRFYRDAAGRLQSEDQCTDLEFHADIAFEEFKKLNVEMCMTVFKRIPRMRS